MIADHHHEKLVKLRELFDEFSKEVEEKFEMSVR